MKVGDLVCTKRGYGGGPAQRGIIVRDNNWGIMRTHTYATCDVLWLTGRFESHIGKRFLEIVKSS